MNTLWSAPETSVAVPDKGDEKTGATGSNNQQACTVGKDE